MGRNQGTVALVSYQNDQRATWPKSLPAVIKSPARLGSIPPPSRERGEYYHHVSADQPTRLAGYLARACVNETPVQMSQLVFYLTEETASGVIEAISNL